MGFMAWKDNIATEDSTMIKILRDAGGETEFQFLSLLYRAHG